MTIGTVWGLTHHITLAKSQTHESQLFHLCSIIDLNVIDKATELLEENTEENLSDLRFGKDFLNLIQKT